MFLKGVGPDARAGLPWAQAGVPKTRVHCLYERLQGVSPVSNLKGRPAWTSEK